MALTPGTMIATPRGERPVESLGVSDRVITRTAGIRRVKSVIRRRLLPHDLARAPHLNPVRIAAHAFGPSMPDRDIAVSRSQLLTFATGASAPWWSSRHLPAKSCVGARGVRTAEVMTVTYFDLELDRGDAILANGIWVDLRPPAVGSQVAATARAEERQEIFAPRPRLRVV